ncbi:sulfite exporter TauE/SafE family protein [Agarivorans sp. MS3-6]|uniref:sulfite exporter TauE/SafE family protein n=1 Tax=Agarivorans sp. TSD2052 TaxID=2937286 RepID=UPI00200C5445|nr:sulfite exporter TauE/SafE family protein [Agarivorans sp. TSD2052]UPW17582.1 sulfite exporter TauE/SafE family protein [Agarivorans sp. TSD2052]
MDFSLWHGALLLTVGVLAGGINTLAGGGSNLTLPALMVMGMPAELANATNRVGIFLQCLTGVVGFNKHGKLDTQDVAPILWPTLVGGLLGAVAASYAPSWIIKYLLLGAMLGMAALMLVKPGVVAPEAGTVAKKVKDTPSAKWSLGLAGFYGGFVQAGVGFILVAALAGSLRYDLVRANALKLVCTLAFTSIALVVFIARGQVLWLPGLVLAVGYIIGAHYAVKFAINAAASTLKWFLFVMTLIGCIAALWL